MERERQTPRQASAGGGPGPGGDELDQIQAETRGILDAADRILDSIRPVNAEDYLQRNRQHSGE